MSLRTDREKIAHLLRRFGLGASEAEIDFYGDKGLQGAIDKLLNFEQTDEGFNIPIEQFSDKQNGQIKMKALEGWWMLRIIATRRPLQEKMTLFWHDHFATSAAKVDVPRAMYVQNEILRKHATGRFQDMLVDVSQDPAMLYWLDNQFNVKGKPNENFAREVMELFTLGIGHYTEKDIQEAARAFTGWSYGVGLRGYEPQKPVRNARFILRPEKHDDGLKTVLGNTGRFDGVDVIGILCGNEQTSKYITWKMWEWFAYPKPAQPLIDRLASKFRSAGLDIKVLVRSIMESPEFYSDQAERKVYKNPVDFCVSTIRQLGLGKKIIENVAELEGKEVLRALGPVGAVGRATKAMGMELFYPPDVSGWDGGANWISSATMVERIKWAEALFGTPQVRGQISLRYPAYVLFTDDNPANAARKLVSVFDAVLPPGKIAQLEQAARTASGGSITQKNAGLVASSVCRLIFSSPEFQFA